MQFTKVDDSVETYDVNGRLTSIKKRGGMVTTLSYDAGGHLLTVTGPFGQVLSFTYNAGGKRVGFVDAGGGAYTYTYDANNNLISVTYPDKSVKQYLYENTSFPNALTGIIDENGSRFATYAYDSSGRAISTVHAGGAEQTTIAYSAGSSTITDALGNVRNYGFNEQFGLFKAATHSGPPCPQCTGQSFTYDANGFIASRTDWNGNITTYVNDARGREISRTEASGTPQARSITTTWHAVYRLPLTITEPGRVTTFTYDANGNQLTKTITAGSLSRTWVYTYNARGQVLTETGPRTDIKQVTTYTYNANGTLASVTDALGHVTQYTAYDPNGRVQSSVDPNGLTTELLYDARGRLLNKIVQGFYTVYNYDAAGHLLNVSRPDNSYFTFSYDAAHRLTGIAYPLGQIAYTLDANDNRIKEQVLAGNPATAIRTRSHTYDAANRLLQDIGALGQTTTYAYDSNGNLISVTDPLNHVTAKTYDALNRLIKLTDPANGVTSYAYDPLDRLTSVTDPRGLVTTYSYDGLSDLLTLQSPDTGATTKTYDAAGNVLTSTDARGITNSYTYDASDRLTLEALASGQSLTYVFDQGANGIGRMTSMTDPSGSTNWTYDVYGGVTQKAQHGAGTTLTTTITRDGLGRALTMKYPSGRQLSYTYDPSGTGLLAEIAVDAAPFLTAYRYEPFGPMSGWYATGLSTPTTYYARVYDMDGRISAMELGGNSTIPGATDAVAITYDAANRITGIANSAGQQTIGYDALDRLSSYALGTTHQVYSYEADGNRASLTSSTGVETYTYGTNNNELQRLAGAVSHRDFYNADGNLRADGTRTFAYDDRGRMVHAATTGGGTSYRINGLGQRVRKSGPNVPTGRREFVYDEAGHLIGEYDAQGHVIEETIWFGDEPVGVLEPGTEYYIYADHLNAPRMVVNKAGQNVWKWDHDPFGNGTPNQATSGGSAFSYNLRLPGQYFDQETGLYYNGFRDYDPTTGRYIESDPLGLDGGANTYAYVGNNPLLSVDAPGLIAPMTASNAPPQTLSARAVTVIDPAVRFKIDQLCSTYDTALCGIAMDFLTNIAEQAASAGSKGIDICEAAVDTAISKLTSFVNEAGGGAPLAGYLQSGLQTINNEIQMLNQPPPPSATDLPTGYGSTGTISVTPAVLTPSLPPSHYPNGPTICNFVEGPCKALGIMPSTATPPAP